MRPKAVTARKKMLLRLLGRPELIIARQRKRGGRKKNPKPKWVSLDVCILAHTRTACFLETKSAIGYQWAIAWHQLRQRKGSPKSDAILIFVPRFTYVAYDPDWNTPFHEENAETPEREGRTVAVERARLLLRGADVAPPNHRKPHICWIMQCFPFSHVHCLPSASYGSARKATQVTRAGGFQVWAML